MAENPISNLIASSNPSQLQNQPQMPNSIPTPNALPNQNGNLPQGNNALMNPNFNNLAFNPMNSIPLGVNGFPNNQNFNPMNQYGNFMPPQMGSFNVPGVSGFSNNQINPMLPQQQNNAMRPFEALPQQRKNLREVL